MSSNQAESDGNRIEDAQLGKHIGGLTGLVSEEMGPRAARNAKFDA